MKNLLVVLAAFLAVGCATSISLTTRGTRVQHVAAADVPIGCEVLGDVPIGIPPDAARPRTEDELIILMRNKTGELGGNYVMVDSSDRRTGAAGETYWVGRGRAYHCPEQPTVDPIHAETTEGGESQTATPPPQETDEEAPPH